MCYYLPSIYESPVSNISLVFQRIAETKTKYMQMFLTIITG